MINHVYNQTEYWNRVAQDKIFTHPIDWVWLNECVSKDALIIDFGCGYGRIVKELNNAGYTNVKGFDTSHELIKRGHKEGVNNITFIQSLSDCMLQDQTADIVLLFAVLTCIPENITQQNLISFLKSKLKPNGLLYISDYYLQEDLAEVRQYEYLNGDKQNGGVFTLPEGATFRHHSKEWIRFLLSDFEIQCEKIIDVITMNGYTAKAFQTLARLI
jgi:2-polyprenyl-3-methyl-5-hydroxy-6-metoxy-1,4-benzoquinol methylase